MSSTVTASIWKLATSPRRILSWVVRSAQRQPGRRGALAQRLVTATADEHYRRVFERLLEQHPELRLPPDAFDSRSVLLACGSLGPGGTERQVVTTARGLAGRGDRSVAIVCVFLRPGVTSFYRPLVETSAVELLELPPWVPRRRAGPKTTPFGRLVGGVPAGLRDIARYVRLFSNRRPAVVHTWLDEINIKAGIAAALVGVPRIVLSCRSVSPTHFRLFQPYMRAGYRALVREPAVVLLNNSTAGAEDYESWLGCAPGSVRVLHNGVDTGMLRTVDAEEARTRIRGDLGIPNDAHIVGSVARLSEEKQPLLAVAAFAELIRRGHPGHLVLVGNGDLRHATESHAVSLGLADRVHFAGHQEHPLEWMAAFDVLLLTSRKEGLPNVLLEAQALGVPVVTTPAGGAVEAVSHGRTGWISEASPAALADALARVLSDTAWRAIVRREGPAFVEEQFGLDRMLSATLAVYDQRALRNETP